MSTESPYLKKRVSRTLYFYNPAYGDQRICSCSHTYVRHFDPYEDYEAVGCKYCECMHFRARKCDDPTEK